MLHLIRKRFETIVVECPNGEAITIEINKIGHKNVHLALDSPNGYKIFRGETYKKVLDERINTTYQLQHPQKPQVFNNQLEMEF